MNRLAVVAFAVGIGAGFVVGAFALPSGPAGAPASDAAAHDASGLPFVPRSLPISFKDAVGDATDTGTGDLSTDLGCTVGYWLDGRCKSLPASPPSVGTSGAHYDITTVAYEGETQTSLFFSMGIARLTEGFPELQTPDAIHRMSYYGVCWAADDDDYCSRWAYVNVMRHDGKAHMEPVFDMYVEDCNEWWWCSWSIPIKVEYGAPAKITFEIPKAYVQTDDKELAAHHMEGWTGWSEGATVFPMWHGGATLHTPLRHVHDHVSAPNVFSTTDRTAELPVKLSFVPYEAETASSVDEPMLAAAPGSSHAHGSPYDKPELDLRGFDMYEEGNEVIVVVAMERFEQVPSYDFDISVALGFESSEVWEIGYRREAGRTYGYAGECIMEECQDGTLFETKVDVTTGAPGFLSIRLPKEKMSFLEGIEPGTATTLFWASSMYTEGSVYFGKYDEPTFGDVHNAFMADSLYGGAPFVFGSGHRAPFEAFSKAHAGH